jgi:hypothetical protein
MRLIILALLGYLLYRLIRGLFSSGQRITRTENGGVIDGREYFFCSKECADRFQSEGESKQ